MIIAIFSMGQFISSDVKKLQNGFQAYYSQQGTSLSGEELWTKWIVPNLTPLRTGDMSLEDFHKEFNQSIKSTFDGAEISFEKFQEIFNSMAEVDQSTLERISKFKEYLESNKHIQFLLISHTNYSHLNFILSQIQDQLPKFGVIDAKNNWDDEAHILFVPSMSSKCPDHLGTLNYALEKLKYKLSSDTQLVSFLNTIKTFDHEGNYPFKYVDTGQALKLDLVANHLEEQEFETVNDMRVGL